MYRFNFWCACVLRDRKTPLLTLCVGKFLPLAIRTSVGANLIYTPLDSPNDWLLAKIMYNVNDFFFAQTAHLASVHEVTHIAYMAAIRSLSEDHPVLALLNRRWSTKSFAEGLLVADQANSVLHQAFAIQPLASVFKEPSHLRFKSLLTKLNRPYCLPPGLFLIRSSPTPVWLRRAIPQICIPTANKAVFAPIIFTQTYRIVDY
jgi:hypothetical protein